MQPIYGDSSGTRFAGWSDAVRSLAIPQHQQSGNPVGKIASEIALVIVAMDLIGRARSMASAWSRRTVISHGWRGACAKSAWWFTGSASRRRPRRSGMPATVSLASRTFWNPGRTTTARKKDPSGKARKFIASATGEPDGDGCERLGSVGSRIQGAQPDCDPRIYGRANLSTPVERAGGFEVREDESGRADIRRKAPSRNRKHNGRNRRGLNAWDFDLEDRRVRDNLAPVPAETLVEDLPDTGFIYKAWECINVGTKQGQEHQDRYNKFD